MIARPKENVKDEKEDAEESRFVGDPVPAEEARQRWPLRYLQKNVRVSLTQLDF